MGQLLHGNVTSQNNLFIWLKQGKARKSELIPHCVFLLNLSKPELKCSGMLVLFCLGFFLQETWSNRILSGQGVKVRRQGSPYSNTKNDWKNNHCWMWANYWNDTNMLITRFEAVQNLGVLAWFCLSNCCWRSFPFPGILKACVVTCHLLDLFYVKFESGHGKAHCRNVFILLSAGGNTEQLSFQFCWSFSSDLCCKCNNHILGGKLACVVYKYEAQSLQICFSFSQTVASPRQTAIYRVELVAEMVLETPKPKFRANVNLP